MIGNYTEEGSVVLFKVTCDPQAAAWPVAACDGPEHRTGASELLGDSSMIVVIKV